MTRQQVEALVRHARMAVPEGAADCLGAARERTDSPLVSEAFLQTAAGRAGLGEEALQSLRGALADIHADGRLHALSVALRDDAHQAVLHQRACEFTLPQPLCLDGFSREAYALLFALGCLEQGLKALAARGIPRAAYEDVCWRMADKQLRILRDSGSVTIADYPWDMNFYACGIFFFDRLYFVPYRWPGPAVYRHEAGQVLLPWPGGACVRRDGQLDGVNGVKDPQAFETIWLEDGETFTAHPVNPVGLIRPAPVTLNKRQWQPVLAENDLLLGCHIPGGEGYTPERWKRSMEQALAFFGRWFPELEIQGFWSESWLYDPGLIRLLPEEGRIISVQRQFYNFPTPEGQAMALLEVFGDEDVDLNTVKAETSLQKSLRDSLLAGTRYHTTGMFVLNDDLPRFGRQPYQTPQDIREAWAQMGVD